ncbi:MAG: tetratricopeptide repeat protein [Actinobacteria bacterium]|nr:tetratricopeptide repeat protein [Actinomycetota bacterium]
MDCTYCGKPVQEGQSFCNYCGRKLSEEAPTEYIPYQQPYYYYPVTQPVQAKKWSKGKIALIVLAAVLGLGAMMTAYGFTVYYRVEEVMDAVDYWNRAESSFRAGDYRKAVEYCDLAIDSAPEFAKPYELRGMSLYEMGRYEEARSDLEKALDLDSDLVNAKEYLDKLDAAARE